jgi:hypothetical protein
MMSSRTLACSLLSLSSASVAFIVSLRTANACAAVH